MNKKIRNWLLSLILPVIWIILMGSLYYRNSSRTILEMAPKVSLTDVNQVILREEWRGIYLNGEKVGYAHYTLKEGKGAESMVYEMENQTQLSLLLGGTKQLIKIKETTTVDKDLRMAGFQFQMQAGNHTTIANGNFSRKRLLIQIAGLGGKSSKIVT